MAFQEIPALEAALAQNRDDMITTLQRWVQQPSVRAAAEADAPFGRDVRAMLDLALMDARRLGFTARDVDGYCMDFEVGEGMEPLAVLAHLDVVPEGEGWNDPPYGGVIRDGRMIGRGTSDDKGPAVAALFALRSILDAGIPLRRPCRMILGCDEESGMEDLDYYDRAVGLPRQGFSPDAEFPMINTEKGITQMTLRAPMGDRRLIELRSGTRVNIVPGKATALLSGDLRAEVAEVFRPMSESCEIEASLEEGNTRVVVTGTPAHGSTPDEGANAAKMLLSVLADLEIGGEALTLLADTSCEENDGLGLGIAGRDAVSGPLTLNLGLLSLEDGMLCVAYDCRFPVLFDGEAIRATVARRLAPAGFVLEADRLIQPHHVPESSELVSRLMDVYNGITGENAQPFAIGGGTYAKHLQEGVAFGMLFPGEVATEHQANESIDLENFVRAARIYAYAILAMCA